MALKKWRVSSMPADWLIGVSHSSLKDMLIVIVTSTYSLNYIVLYGFASHNTDHYIQTNMISLYIFLSAVFL